MTREGGERVYWEMKPIADVGDMAVFTFWACFVIDQISLLIRVAEIDIFWQNVTSNFKRIQ